MTSDGYKYAIKTGQYPPYVYRYQPDDKDGHTIDSIKNHYLWFSNFKDFNDPYDGHVRASYDYTEAEKNAFFVLHQNDWDVISQEEFYHNPKQFFQRRLNNARLSAKVCCFSECSDNILMWSHYASSHKGLCLEFDYANNETNLFEILRSVQYSRSYDCCNYIRESMRYIEKMAFTKALDWSYEKEYRAAFPDLIGNKVEYTPSALKRIIFGCRASEEFKEKVKAVAPNNVQFAHCELNTYHYKLDIIVDENI